MLNVLTKTKPWIVASLLVATSIFGDTGEIAQDSCRPKSCEQPKPVCPPPKPVCPPKPCPPPPVCPPKPCCEQRPPIQMCPAYNMPARVDVRGCWDVYAGASFIYWQARQENMEFASSQVAATVGTVQTNTIVNYDFSYKPGFKVLLGMNFDHDGWDGYAEYTWFKNSTSNSVGLVAATPTTTTALFTIKQIPAINGGNNYTSISEAWDLKLQFLDTALARTYYVGTNLTFRSIFGARFAWLTQYKTQTATNDGTTGAGTAGTYFMRQNYASWGAGAMAGLNTNWIFGEDFRMIGNGSFDLLYTRVATSNTKFIVSDLADVTTATYGFPESRPDFLMPHTNIEIGFGWGTYFDCYNWHIDLSATYCFQTFWNANLNREWVDDVDAYNSLSPNGNLYVHGLTASLKLDF
jgi:hypothetical protein